MIHRILDSLRLAIDRVLTRVGDIGGSIAWGFERAVAATFGRALHATEGFERIGDWFAGLFRLLTWPVRVAASLAGAALSAVMPAHMIDAATARRMQLAQRLGLFFWDIVERLNLDVVARAVAWVTQPLWRPLAAVGGFAYAWLATRPYRQMVWGLPVLLALPLAGAAAWGLTWGRSDIEARYRGALQDARDAKDLAMVKLMERKLQQLGVDTQGADFRAATALANADRLPEAFDRMQQLAPQNELGYLPAHHWIVLRLLGGEIDLPQDEKLRLADAHLRQLEEIGLKGPEMDLLRAVWLAQNNQLDEAAERLKPLVSNIPWAAIQYLEINLQRNRLDEARHAARAVRLHSKEAERNSASLDALQLRAWTQAEQLLGDRAAWSVVVRRWLAAAPDDPAARQHVAELDELEFADMLRSAHPSPPELARRLTEMARLMTRPEQLEPRVVQLYQNRTQTPALAEMFERLAADAATPTPILVGIGTGAALEGDVKRARQLLSRVLAEVPAHAAAWNNLAWAQSREPDRDLAAALTSVNRAMAIAPEEFRFRETRGQILVQLGRWDEAVTDLEFALNGMPDAKPVHAALATAYERLGQTELAAIHLRQSL